MNRSVSLFNLAGQSDQPIPTRFLTPQIVQKIPTLQYGPPRYSQVKLHVYKSDQWEAKFLLQIVRCYVGQKSMDFRPYRIQVVWTFGTVSLRPSPTDSYIFTLQLKNMKVTPVNRPLPHWFCQIGPCQKRNYKQKTPFFSVAFLEKQP